MSNSKQDRLLSRYNATYQLCKDRSILTRRDRLARETREEETIRFALRNGGSAAIQRENEDAD